MTPINKKPAWIVVVQGTPCVCFARTRAKAKFLAVNSYWEAFGNSGWPKVTAHRANVYDRHRLALSPLRKSWSEDYIMDTMLK